MDKNFRVALELKKSIEHNPFEIFIKGLMKGEIWFQV